MLVFGSDIPLVEVILAMGIITVIILLEAIAVLVLMIYYKKTGKSSPIRKEFLAKLRKLKNK